jgi:hypothetical protein
VAASRFRASLARSAEKKKKKKKKTMTLAGMARSKTLACFSVSKRENEMKKWRRRKARQCGGGVKYENGRHRKKHGMAQNIAKNSRGIAGISEMAAAAAMAQLKREMRNKRRESGEMAAMVMSGVIISENNGGVANESNGVMSAYVVMAWRRNGV